jgi:site-specific DNA-methyltransferase (adenine-specific)
LFPTGGVGHEPPSGAGYRPGFDHWLSICGRERVCRGDYAGGRLSRWLRPVIVRALVSQFEYSRSVPEDVAGSLSLARLRGPGAKARRFISHELDRAKLVQANCFEWLRAREAHTIEVIVTDPPYGLVEYSHTEQSKLRKGRGGIWRIPPSFDGHRRAPLPRFTVLDEGDLEAMHDFFFEFGQLVLRATVPSANVIVASNPLLYHVVASAMSSAGLEMRGSIIRLVMTMRGGDRPKNAHKEFTDVSVMPRSKFEPWIVLRHPLDGRVQDNLRKWKTGGFRRPSHQRPFGDVIKSSPTPRAERQIAAHPSLKPQAFLRALVRAALPLGEGVILDPFAGSGSTLAAANATGYASIGIEKDPHYLAMARLAIPRLSELLVEKVDPI